MDRGWVDGGWSMRFFPDFLYFLKLDKTSKYIEMSTFAENTVFVYLLIVVVVVVNYC